MSPIDALDMEIAASITPAMAAAGAEAVRVASQVAYASPQSLAFVVYRVMERARRSAIPKDDA